MQGFLLGLANGTTCLAYCVPVLIPFLLGEGRRTRQNWMLLAKFLGGRLVGYLLFGLLAFLAGQLLLSAGRYRNQLFGAATIALAALLAWYGLAKPPTPCGGSFKGARLWLRRWPALLPLGLGFLTGLNLCPPFLMAITGAAGNGTLWGSLLFFGAFFVGTSLYFIPLPFLGAFHRSEALRIIGKMTALLMALYYLYSGVLMLLGVPLA